MRKAIGLSARSFVERACLFIIAGLAVALAAAPFAAADCPEEDPLQNYAGGGTVVCPCFAVGEEAGAVLTAPSEHYPIEILRVGIGWGSMYGGAPESFEEAIHIYDAGLPNPGTPIFTQEGPVLTDGVINEFDFEPVPGEIVIDSGAFTVTLEFANANAGDIYAPSMVHDGGACQSEKNVVYAIPGGWYDACVLGVSGDWVVYAIYRQVNCGAGVDEELIASNQPALLMEPEPNPFSHETRFEFILTAAEHVGLSIYDIHGRLVANLVDSTFPAGRYSSDWAGTRADGTPAASGIYFAVMQAGGHRSSQRVVISR
jgi:hypothetical protein